jgi:hypothetical protein
MESPTAWPLVRIVVALAVCIIGVSCGCTYERVVDHWPRPEEFKLLPGAVPSDFAVVIQIDPLEEPTSHTVVKISRGGGAIRTTGYAGQEHRVSVALTPGQLQGLYDTLVDTDFESLSPRYPTRGVGDDIASGIQRYYVCARGVEWMAATYGIEVPELARIRAAVEYVMR